MQLKKNRHLAQIMSSGKNGDLCMAVCTKMVVLTVPGWSTSEGVAAEIEYAKKVNMPIAYIDPYSYNNLA